MTQPAAYVGRFAPSPTGPLHFGSLVTGLASFLEARRHSGNWLLRIENIDPPRETPDAADDIIRTLSAFGFEWNGPVRYQGESIDAHLDAINRLVREDLAYHCSCSRSDLQNAVVGPLGRIYPGTCRHATNRPTAHDSAIRVRTNDRPVVFFDGLRGRYSQRLESESGDFVVQRRDGRIAYQLAVVVDDHLQGVTEVVRGADLLASTPRQIWLQSLLGYTSPHYVHVPTMTNRQGEKLSKAHGATALSREAVASDLVKALQALGQEPPANLQHEAVDNVWLWAFSNWSIDRIPCIDSVAVS